MQTVLSENLSSKPMEQIKTIDKLLLIFLALAIVLPAYILVLYLLFDGFYWKAFALYCCTAILVILGVIKIVSEKIKIRKEHIYSILPVVVYLLAVIISTLLSPYSAKAIWGQWLFHEGAITLVCYGIIFIAARFLINSYSRLKFILASICIWTIIIIIDSIARYDIHSKITFYLMMFYILIAVIFKYLIPQNSKFGRVSKYIWITALVLFIDAGIRAWLTTPDIKFPIYEGGTFGHRNYLASFFTLIFLPAVAGYFYSIKKKTNIIFYLLSCIFFCVLILNHTRSSWVGNGIGFMLFIVLGKGKISFKKLAILFFSFIIIIGVVNFSNGNLISTRFNTMVNDVKLLADKGSDKTYVGTTRYRIWELSIPLIPKHLLFGIGPDMFERIFPQQEYRDSVAPQYRGTAANAHNEYLNMILNLGIIGLLAYFWIILSIFKKYFRFYKNFGIENINRYILLGVFCGWCAYLIQAFFNNSVVSTSPTLWAMMGILSAVPFGEEIS
ncbi:MAG: O-antigen ligase family protein [Ignavibacteriales bacterium]